MASSAISPAHVLSLDAPATGFLCPFEANTYGIDFLSFQIEDAGGSGAKLFEISKDPSAPPPQLRVDWHRLFPPNFDMDLLRQIKYRFPAEFLKFRTISTTLTFRVGNNEVKNFRMIESHYFRNKLIRSYDFNFHFVMPNSTNTWEAVYDLPELSEAEEQDMIANPYEATSDSYYFVENKLVMHNKAAYCYDPALPLP